METNSTPGNCLYCGKVLKGRKDKKFCNDGCRNTFHNELNGPVGQIVNPIVNILKKNRTVLLSFLEKGMVDGITRDRLLKAGYDFQYYTEHIHTDQLTVYFSFNVGIQQISKNEYQFRYRAEFLKYPWEL